MLVIQVEARVREIRAVAEKRDYEKAHSLQDELYEDVLLEIARNGSPRSRSSLLAQAAVEARKIDFERHKA